MNRPGSLYSDAEGKHLAIRRDGILTGAGVIGLIPALVLVAAAVTGRHPPSLLVHPALVFGGLGGALVASLLAIGEWDLIQTPGMIRVVCTIRKRIPNLLVLCASVVLFVITVGYLLTENFQPR